MLWIESASQEIEESTAFVHTVCVIQIGLNGHCYLVICQLVITTLDFTLFTYKKKSLRDVLQVQNFGEEGQHPAQECPQRNLHHRKGSKRLPLHNIGHILGLPLAC